MDNLQPSICNSKQFAQIYKDLSRFGDKEHESIVIDKDDNLCFPKTTQKQLLGKNKNTDLTVATFSLDFFEKHISLILQEPDAELFICRFTSLFHPHEASLKARFLGVQKNIFSMKAIKNLEGESQAILEAAENEKKIILKKAKKESQALLTEAENSRQSLATECEKRQKEIGRLELKKALLEEKIGDLKDTLLVCKETPPLTVHMKLLEKVNFFKCNELYSKVLKKSSLTEEEKKKYTYKFDFTDFARHTLLNLINWLDKPASLDNVQEISALLELYRLADFLTETLLSKGCLQQLKSKLKAENYIEILSTAEYSPKNLLIQLCCEYVVKNQAALLDYQKFTDMQPEYFIEIAQKNLSQAKNAHFCDAILLWAKAQAQKNNKTIQDMLYEPISGCTLVKCLPLKHLSAQDFLTQIHPHLKLQEANEWLQFYLKKALKPSKPAQEYSVLNTGNGVEVTWNVPISKFNQAMHERGNKLTFLFSFNNATWTISITCDSVKELLKLVVNNDRYFLSDAIIYMEMNNHRSKIMFNDTFKLKTSEIVKQLDFKNGYLPLKFYLYK